MPLTYPTALKRAFGTLKSPEFNTDVQAHKSGEETRIANQAYPRWKIKLVYDFLRDTVAAAEFKTLVGFFLQCKGAFRNFLFVDPDDNQVAGQTIGVGTGSAVKWTAVRTFGGFVEPVGAITALTAVYVDGVAQTGWSYSGRIITLASPPASGAVVSADFSYAFVCRFQDDQMDLEKFAYQLWKAGEVNLISVFEDAQ